MIKEDQRLGLSVENLIIDSNDKREPELIDKAGIKIPKLDLSSIFIQREALPSQPGKGENGESESDPNDSYYQEGDETLDSK